MRSKGLELHPEALAEADGALLWYCERSAGAARAFVSEVQRALNRVAEAPERWPLAKARENLVYTSTNARVVWAGLVKAP